MGKIQKLSDKIINLIAAGEIIERPFSIIKELVENSIDAGSTEIKIWIEQGGKTLIVISDNGDGISYEDLQICYIRHTTSKLQEENLSSINSFGFRGEALASIDAVSKMSIASNDGNGSYELYEGKIKSSNTPKGTKIIVKDLFYSSPVRMKFLKTSKYEAASCISLIKKISLINVNIAFSVYSDAKLVLDLPIADNIESRVYNLFGTDFKSSSINVSYKHEAMELSGIISLPSLNKSSTEQQIIFVNGRLVKDKIFAGAIKAAYQDFLPGGRHPMLYLSLELPPHMVDVNVHPAKSEVRFRDSYLVRSFLLTGIQQAITDAMHRTLDQSNSAAEKFILPNMQKAIYQQNSFSTNYNDIAKSNNSLTSNNYSNIKDDNGFSGYKHSESSYNLTENKTENLYNDSFTVTDNDNENKNNHQELSLGLPIGQIDKTYIISKTNEHLIITDQHAAHERIVYEKLKEQQYVRMQKLLISIKIKLDDKKYAALYERNHYLFKLGLEINYLNNNLIEIVQIPQLLSNVDISSLIEDIADDILTLEDGCSLAAEKEKILGTYACHHSIRAGRTMNMEEMEELLRTIENTPHAGQCNHGRPTYVKISIKDIGKLLGRT